MYKIPGIVSLIQKKKQILTSEDVVTIASQIWKNKENPALLKCICPQKDPNYLFDPYNPDLPKRIKRKYKKSKEVQHDTLENEEEIDLESGIPNKQISTVSNCIQQTQPIQYKESGQDMIQNSKTGSFWTDLANVVFGTDQIETDVEHSYHNKYKEIRVEYNRNEYIKNPKEYSQTYNHYGAQLNSINIV